MNTLKGVFPEPKVAPKRNFVRENMANIKQMQGIIQTLKASGCPQPVIRGREASSLSKRRSRSATDPRHRTQPPPNRIVTAERPKMITVDRTPTISPRGPNLQLPSPRTLRDRSPKGRDVGIQTEVVTRRLYDTGTILYPTNTGGEAILSIRTKQKPQPVEKRTQIRPGDGDTAKKDFVKENAQVIRNFAQRIDKNLVNPPPTYKKGVVPKYLRERKEELYRQAKSLEGDEKCPEGHVLLPENERKETLRMLRQSYAELITELNLMPVRSDTLKIRNRKIELESQLKKLDEGIKVFTRPKVYVKIGA